MPIKKRRSPSAKFRVGDKVRVKRGVEDADYPDMPLGGWAGTVTKIEKADTFTVRWTDETMEAIHPVFKHRCEIDGLNAEEYVLTGDDLERDAGGPLDIEHPTKITTRSLSLKDQDDRIRMVFGITSNYTLPEVDDATLEQYCTYLSKNLVFPFQAECRVGYGRRKRVEVIRLGDLDGELLIDDEYGLLCDARLEHQTVTVPLGELDAIKGRQNRRLVDDYRYWLHNWR
jgi:hypothetical protein